MPKAFIFGFVDLAFLTTFLFWVAANNSQIAFEEVVLPFSYSAEAISPGEYGDDLETITVRWFEEGAIPEYIVERYEDTEVASWVGFEGPFVDYIWQGETLYPALPEGGFASWVRGCGADKYWKLADTAEAWAQDSPVLIRAHPLTPFKYISGIFEVFSREKIQQQNVFFAARLEE